MHAESAFSKTMQLYFMKNGCISSEFFLKFMYYPNIVVDGLQRNILITANLTINLSFLFNRIKVLHLFFHWMFIEGVSLFGGIMLTKN